MKHICSDWSSLNMSTSIDIYMFLPLFDSDWVWGPYRHLFAGAAVVKWDLHVISTSGLFQTTSLHSCTRPFLIWPLVHSSLRSLIILLSCCTHEGGTGSHFREREKKMRQRYEAVVGGRSTRGCRLAQNNLAHGHIGLEENGGNCCWSCTASLLFRSRVDRLFSQTCLQWIPVATTPASTLACVWGLARMATGATALEPATTETTALLVSTAPFPSRCQQLCSIESRTSKNGILDYIVKNLSLLGVAVQRLYK